MGGYTVGELERDTGFSRRTIAYYVQLGLLPRVGRLGPKTRYPEQVLDRLRFIRRVREAQEAGELPPVSLSDIREAFERVSPGLISGVADGRIAVTGEIFFPLRPGLSSPWRRLAALKDRLEVREPEAYVRESIRQGLQRYGAEPVPQSAPRSDAFGEGEPRAYSPLREADRGDDRELSELLAALEQVAGSRGETSRSSVDTWSRIQITPDISLSVRRLAEGDEKLLETLGRKLRRLVRRAQDSMS